jgi:hypothetical protein
MHNHGRFGFWNRTDQPLYMLRSMVALMLPLLSESALILSLFDLPSMLPVDEIVPLRLKSVGTLNRISLLFISVRAK